MKLNIFLDLSLKWDAEFEIGGMHIDIFRSSVAYHIAKTVNVPADATIDVISKAVYLEEGDVLRLTANAVSDLEAVCSYEEIS